MEGQQRKNYERSLRAKDVSLEAKAKIIHILMFPIIVMDGKVEQKSH